MSTYSCWTLHFSLNSVFLLHCRRFFFCFRRFCLFNAFDMSSWNMSTVYHREKRLFVQLSCATDFNCFLWLSESPSSSFGKQKKNSSPSLSIVHLKARTKSDGFTGIQTSQTCPNKRKKKNVHSRSCRSHRNVDNKNVLVCFCGCILCVWFWFIEVVSQYIYIGIVRQVEKPILDQSTRSANVAYDKSQILAIDIQSRYAICRLHSDRYFVMHLCPHMACIRMFSLDQDEEKSLFDFYGFSYHSSGTKQQMQTWSMMFCHLFLYMNRNMNWFWIYFLIDQRPFNK